jgi:hypothetical protein
LSEADPHQKKVYEVQQASEFTPLLLLARSIPSPDDDDDEKESEIIVQKSDTCL